MAKNARRRAVKRASRYAEGEEERVLRAVQVVVDERLARPTLIGRPEVIAQRIAKFGLRLSAGATTTSSTPSRTTRYRDYWTVTTGMTARSGVTAQYAKIEMRRRHTDRLDAMLKKAMSTA